MDYEKFSRILKEHRSLGITKEENPPLESVIAFRPEERRRGRFSGRSPMEHGRRNFRGRNDSYSSSGRGDRSNYKRDDHGRGNREPREHTPGQGWHKRENA